MDLMEKRKFPEISVIMGAFNCEKTIHEAIDCIIKQTFTDWELIICDDGSVDKTYEKIEWHQAKYPDKIILLKNEVNQGLSVALNRCLGVARGKYIARMDADDHCSYDRLEKERKILESESNISIVSTDMEYFDETGVWGYMSHPTYPTAKDFLNGTPFCHAACMVRREAYDAVEGYSEADRFMRVEDYHLWIKMYKRGYLGKNIHEPLYQMRDDRNAYTRRRIKYRINEANVKCLSVKELNLPVFGYVFALRPIIVGLLPRVIYDCLHKRNLQRLKSDNQGENKSS